MPFLPFSESIEPSRNLSLLVSNRPESEEYTDVKKYRKKGRDVTRKRRILTSLAEKDGYVVSKKSLLFSSEIVQCFCVFDSYGLPVRPNRFYSVFCFISRPHTFDHP